MNEIDGLKKRVAELEAEVAKLKAGGHVIHSHYHYVQPVYAGGGELGCGPQWVSVRNIGGGGAGSGRGNG